LTHQSKVGSVGTREKKKEKEKALVGITYAGRRASKDIDAAYETGWQDHQWWKSSEVGPAHWKSTRPAKAT